MMLHNFQKINLQHRNQIAQIEFMKADGDQIASIGHSYNLNVLDLATMKIVRQKNLERNYLTSLQVGQHNIFVGTGEGQIMMIDPKSLDVVSKYQLHSDCITDIIEQDNRFITVGSDGVINFLDKRKMQILSSLEVDSPIKQIVNHQGTYYLAGVKSYTIDSNQKVDQINRYDYFYSHGDRFFGSNDQHGLVYISMKDKKYVPCERMVGYKDGLLGTSWTTVTYFIYDQYQRISWKSVRVPEFQKGDSITSLLTKNQVLFGGAESGNLYMFSFDPNYSWLYS